MAAASPQDAAAVAEETAVRPVEDGLQHEFQSRLLALLVHTWPQVRVPRLELLVDILVPEIVQFVDRPGRRAPRQPPPAAPSVPPSGALALFAALARDFPDVSIERRQEVVDAFWPRLERALRHPEEDLAGTAALTPATSPPRTSSRPGPAPRAPVHGAQPSTPPSMLEPWPAWGSRVLGTPSRDPLVAPVGADGWQLASALPWRTGDCLRIISHSAENGAHDFYVDGPVHSSLYTVAWLRYDHGDWMDDRWDAGRCLVVVADRPHSSSPWPWLQLQPPCADSRIYRAPILRVIVAMQRAEPSSPAELAEA